MNAPTRFESVMPEMPVRNLSASVAFYTDVLGFRMEHLHGGEYAVMRRDNVRVGLKRAPAPEAEPLAPGQGRFYAILSGGIDDYYAAVARTITAASGRVIEPLSSRPYGLKDFRVVDPDGNRLAFGERL